MAHWKKYFIGEFAEMDLIDRNELIEKLLEKKIIEKSENGIRIVQKDRDDFDSTIADIMDIIVRTHNVDPVDCHSSRASRP